VTLKSARWILIALGGILVALTIAAAAGSRTETLRRLVIDGLADRLDSEVELGAFSVDIFPTVTARGQGLVIRHKKRRDVPPLVTVGNFSMEGGIIGLLNRPRRFRTVTLTELRINIPPGGMKIDRPETAPAAPAGDPRRSPFIIDRLVADGAELRIIPRTVGKEPKLFAIHALEMRQLGVVERMPFDAQLTNPVPKGMIQTKGEFGPWRKGDPGATPLVGRYTFANADFSTIKGIAGILESTGEFGGQLERIAVKGETRTPDFRLDISEQPVELTTRFQAVVDGTDGDTYLNDVYATFGKTSLTAKGAIAGTPGVKGRTVKLDVQIDEGRIEDLLRLAVKAERPLMEGDVALATAFLLPPGDRSVVERLQLQGNFDVSARFTNREVQTKLTGMSQRARGVPTSGRAENIVSDLRGHFRLQDATLALSGLTFRVPGATVALAGTYGLKSEALMFDGTLQMEATISEAAGGGLRSVLLKAVDPFFRKGKAGAVLPIKVRGTRSEPKFGLDVVKAITPK
jgi:AsmA-like C-terminal region